METTKFNKRYGELLNELDDNIKGAVNNSTGTPLDDDDLLICDELEKIIDHYDIDIDDYKQTKMLDDLKQYINDSIQYEQDEFMKRIINGLDNMENSTMDEIEELIREDEREITKEDGQ